MKYDVFLSYSRKDIDVANKIKDVLESNEIKCFIDHKAIAGGDDFPIELADQILDSPIFLFLGSQNSFDATWTPAELSYAYNHRKENNITIIPYLIDEAKMPRNIDLILSQFNIRNYKEHPIETTLLDDIVSAKEKYAPKGCVEDIKMAKAIIDKILSGSHNREYNINLLIELGDFNWGSGRFRSSKERPNEAREYYLKALELSRQSEPINMRNISRLLSLLAKIEEDLGNFSKAEDYYEEVLGFCRKMTTDDGGIIRSRKSALFDCLLDIATVQVQQNKLALAKDNCTEAKSILCNQEGGLDIGRKALKLSELYATILRKLGENDKADQIYDDVLSQFREKSEDKVNFSFMLGSFAESNRKTGAWTNVVKYLTEALTYNPLDTELLLSLADAYISIKQIDKAKEVYQQLFTITLKSDIHNRRYNIASTNDIVGSVVEFYDKYEMYQDVEDCFQGIIAKYIVSSFEKQSFDRGIVGIYKMKADWQMKIGHYSDAIKSLTKSLLYHEKSMGSIISGEKIEILFRKAQAQYCVGCEYQALESLQMACDALKTCESYNDSIHLVYAAFNDYSKCHFESGISRLKEMIKYLYKNNSSMGKSNRGSYFTSFGWFAMLMGEYDFAKEPLELALKYSENKRSKANAQNNLGRLYALIGKFQQSEELLHSACNYFKELSVKEKKEVGAYAESLGYLGLLNLQQANYEKARAYFEQSLEKYAEYAIISNSRKPDAQEVEQWLEKAKSRIGVEQ